MNWRPILGLAVLAAVFAALLLPTLSQATASQRNGVTAVRHNDNIAYSEGSTVGLITPSGAPVGTLPACSSCNVAGELAWSPGGRKLAFVRGTVHGGLPKPDKLALFESNANGAHLRRLLGCRGYCLGSSISWAPNGSTIAATHGRRLALVNVKTRRQRMIARCAQGSGYDPWSPAWSPSGSKIAFGCGASLYVATRTGRHAHVIARVLSQAQIGDLAWSPDGKTLAFDDPNSIYTVGADGSHLTILVEGQPGNGPGFPSWSPDGTRILYAFTPGAPSDFFSEVWVMNADGTQKHRLYRSSQPLADYSAPVWSPNGKQIAFSIFTNAESRLMVMNADGSGLHGIAPFARTLAWQPLP